MKTAEEFLEENNLPEALSGGTLKWAMIEFAKLHVEAALKVASESESDEEIQMEKELVKFLKYIKEVHVDDYGHLEICDSGDELDPTVERVVKEYLKSK